ncbi:MAG: hypothetical protein JKY17_04195 [Magnetovibrio sp.]|nr:hypothetical protein [Magnetovibrio sp.]
MRNGVRLLFVFFAILMLWGVATFHPPTWLFPFVFAFIFLFYSNTLRERVPLFLSNSTTWVVLSEVVRDEDTTPNKRPCFVDLGCGLGGAVAYLARAHPSWDVVGVETAPAPYLISKLRIAFIPNASVHFQSLWNVDLGTFNMVYAFLSPVPMKRLCTKVKAEMTPGTLFVSNSFWPDDEPFDSDIVVNDRRESHLLCKRL